MLVYIPTKLGDFAGAIVGIHIPASWKPHMDSYGICWDIGNIMEHLEPYCWLVGGFKPSETY